MYHVYIEVTPGKGKNQETYGVFGHCFREQFCILRDKKNKEYNTLITKNYFLFYIFLLLRIETRCFERIFLVISAVFI